MGTGNEWGAPFEKVPGKFCLVEIDFGLDDDDTLLAMTAADGMTNLVPSSCLLCCESE